MTDEPEDKSLKEELDDTRNEMQRMAEEIRVKLHLAGMDAKDAWNEMQPQIEDFEQKFDIKAEEIGEELKALGSDIKKRLVNILEKIRAD